MLFYPILRKRVVQYNPAIFIKKAYGVYYITSYLFISMQSVNKNNVKIGGVLLEKIV